MQQIAILGAGLVGCLLAYRLSKQNYRVCLYEQRSQGDSQSAAYTAAAMLAPLAESAISDRLITEMGIASLRRWPDWIAELNSECNCSIFFQQQGTLVVWHPQDREEANRFYQRLDNDLTQHAHYQPQKLNRAALVSLEPALTHRFAEGWYLPSEGQLDNHALLDALLNYLAQKKVKIHWGKTISIDEIQADLIIDCRGVGAKTKWLEFISEQTNQLRGVRGEIVRVHAPEVALQRPIRLIHPRYPLYIAPKPNNIYVIGATEIESEDYSPMSVRSALELLGAAYSIHPGFAEARILEIRSQCRPAFSDNLPKIYWDGRHCLAINGLYRHGYLIAPAIVEAASALIEYLQTPSLMNYAAWQAQQSWPTLFHTPLETHHGSIY